MRDELVERLAIMDDRDTEQRISNLQQQLRVARQSRDEWQTKYDQTSPAAGSVTIMSRSDMLQLDRRLWEAARASARAGGAMGIAAVASAVQSRPA